MLQTESLSSRLACYSTLAAGLVPFAGASANIIGQTNMNLVIGPGATASVPVDFGPGFGEVFAFQIVHQTLALPATSYFSSSIYIDRYDAVFQFNPFNTGGAYAAFHAGSVGGGNPARLPGGYFIGYSAGTFNSMTSSFSTFHDLVQAGTYQFGYNGVPSFTSSYSFGDWAGGQRGYLGFAMFIGLDTYFGWFDVEGFVGGNQLIIHGWGLNTTSFEGLEAGEIPAPAAGGLAALALGAAGVRRVRRKVA